MALSPTFDLNTLARTNPLRFANNRMVQMCRDGFDSQTLDPWSAGIDSGTITATTTYNDKPDAHG